MTVQEKIADDKILPLNKILCGDVLKKLKTLPDNSLHCIVTSPPYWALRNYGVKGQIGMEKTPASFVRKLVKVFRECRRVLRNDGTLWLNIGDSYASSGKNRTEEQATKNAGINGSLRSQLQSLAQQKKIVGGLKPKDLVGIPWTLALALRKDGWYLRQDIIWHKKTCMPESVQDRCTKSHEYIFLLSKSAKYFFDYEAIMEPIAASTANDARLMSEAFTTNRPERGFIGNPTQGAGMLRPSRVVREGIDTRGGNQGTGGIPVIGGKGNRKTFGGGGVYTNGQAFNNSADVENDSVGNNPAESFLRNKRSVWSVAPAQFKEAHFATFPEDLIVDCIKAGCPVGGVVLDPFFGAGTTGVVAGKLQRNFIGIELNPAYVAMAEKRLRNELGLFFDATQNAV